MNKIYVIGNFAVNVAEGEIFTPPSGVVPRQIIESEIKQYGMEGFEHLVGPHNTVVNNDGGISFTPPDLGNEQAKAIQLGIIALEAQQTPRRLREAVLTEEGNAWLQNIEDQIAAKRSELAGLA